MIELILDLAGYAPAQGRLSRRRLLEPSCGDGAFITAAVRRLLVAERERALEIDWSDPQLARAITACDINSAYVARARADIATLLSAEGCPSPQATTLAETWVVHADFLLTVWPEKFDFVIGNPPYVRIEDLPSRVLRRYRELYPTCADRADLYVAFFESGLDLLSSSGCLAYICANRFTKNLYGRHLRQLIATQFHVRYYVNLEHTQPFVSDVSAYPCITVIDRQRGAPTHAATLSSVTTEALDGVRHASAAASPLAEFAKWYPDGAPWITTERSRFAAMADLAARLPLLEDSAAETRVGIGVATGADRIYVQRGVHPTVEPACQLPLVMAADISPSGVAWSGHHLINPFSDADDGTLRDLAAYPGFAAYLESHAAALRRRHVAGKRPEAWYRTIDRVSAGLTRTPKLLLPDIQAGGIVGWDEGRYYPHHNVYWITSAGWDLRALQGLLRSTLVFEQVRAFSVQMRGGSVRYQAQVLRKLRVPGAATLSRAQLEQLRRVAAAESQAEIDAAAADAYGF